MNLGELAQEKLAKIAPELTKFILSFNDMTEELPENSGVQVGCFVLAQGGSNFFVPVIAKDGTVYPIDSIFMADKKQFMPLTKKTVEQITANQNENMGRKAKTPSSAIRNPDLKDVIVPPRTGKYVYASGSRIADMAAAMKPEMRKELLQLLTEDASLVATLSKFLDVEGLVEAVKSNLPVEETVSVEIPQVITAGKGLDEQAIQDILQKGYHVKGAPATLRVAVESFGANNFGYAKRNDSGRGYMFVKRDGNLIGGAILPTNDLKFLVAFEDGSVRDFTHSRPPVIVDQEINYKDIIDRLKLKKIGEIGQVDGRVVIFNGTNYDTASIRSVLRTPQGLTISCRDGVERIEVLNNMHGLSVKERDVWFLNPVCTFAPYTHVSNEFETDLGVALRRHEMRAMSHLAERHTLVARGGVFSIDGREVGGKADVVRIMVVDQGLQLGDAERFMKSAEEKGKVEIVMSAPMQKSAEKQRVTPMPQYGERISPDEPYTGNKDQRLRGANLAIRKATDTKDKQVVEATIMSELLSDPDMYETIGEYLPDILQAVDKMGRILFLARLKSDKLSDDMDPEALSDLITAIRNTYRSLGENCVRLEQLSRDV